MNRKQYLTILLKKSRNNFKFHSNLQGNKLLIEFQLSYRKNLKYLEVQFLTYHNIFGILRIFQNIMEISFLGYMINLVNLDFHSKRMEIDYEAKIICHNLLVMDHHLIYGNRLVNVEINFPTF